MTSRRGSLSLEIFVSFTLLSSVLAFATPLVVRHNRLLISQRDYRLALDELSNQLERISALPPEELTAALEKLAPSEFLAARLAGADLRGQLDRTDIGQRLTLQLTWDEPERRAAPVTLAAWIVPAADRPVAPRTRSNQP